MGIQEKVKVFAHLEFEDNGLALTGQPLADGSVLALLELKKRFRIGPHQVSLNSCPPEFNRRGILLTIAIMKEKQQEKNYLE